MINKHNILCLKYIYTHTHTYTHSHIHTYIYVYVSLIVTLHESKNVIIQIQFLCAESTFSAQIAEGFVVC